MQDQTYELTQKGISAVYLGSAQVDPHAEDKVFQEHSDVSVFLISPEWLFGGDGKNLTKVQSLCQKNRFGLIAIDEAHLMYDWQDFRDTSSVMTFTGWDGSFCNTNSRGREKAVVMPGKPSD